MLIRIAAGALLLAGFLLFLPPLQNALAEFCLIYIVPPAGEIEAEPAHIPFTVRAIILITQLGLMAAGIALFAISVRRADTGHDADS